MKRKSLRELKELILSDIEYSKSFLSDEYIVKDQNPQVIEMKLKEKARLESIGTTMEVAKHLNRNYIGCDINPKAIDITNKRML